MADKNIIFYDFEVFSKAGFWCVVFIEFESKEQHVIINDVKGLQDFYEQHKDWIYVGYNSRNYDQWVLKGILSGMNPATVNDKLIMSGMHGFQIVRDGNKYPVNNFDVGDILHSLKQLEAFMGSDIKETSVPFDIDRPLTQSEIDETIKYCVHDVSETIKVFNYRREEFDSQLSIIEAFELPMNMFNKTKAQLSAHILGAVKQHTFDDEFEITIPDTLVLSDKYQYIVDWYKNPANLNYKDALYSNDRQHSRSLETIVGGIPHTFAWGGVHGAIANYSAEGIILCCDVASLYPSIMIEYGYLSRKLLKPEKYKVIKDTRMELKKKKDKRQKPYKIVLNSTYGILKDKNNALYDPLMSNNVCVTGQLLILDLIEKVESYGKLIQSNTDGIYLLVDNMETVEKIKSIAHEWELRTRLNLEWDIYNKIYQKDVNNYIIIEENGHYKSKGSYLKKLSPIDYDLPIINTALIEYFVHDTPIEDTINNSNKLIDFQKVVKLSALYKNVKHGNELLSEKVHRVFASTDINASSITKTKMEKGVEREEKIANTPDHCFINNDDMTDITVPEYLDRQYYIDLAKERLSQFLEVEEKPVNEVSNVLYQNMINSKTFYDFLVTCDENTLTKVKTKTFKEYVTADCCKLYGKTKKLLDYIDYFTLLYGKKSITDAALHKKVTDENIVKMIIDTSEISKSGKTYALDYEKALRLIFDYLDDIDIEIQLIMQKQVDLFKEVRYTDDTVIDSKYYVLNTRNEIAPNITVYRIKDGLIENRKVSKNAYSILPIQDGDIITVKSTVQQYGVKPVGKNELGQNIVEQDKSKIYDVITSYDIDYRDFSKSITPLSEEGE